MPRWAQRFGVLTVVGLAAGTAAAFVAKKSGEALADTVGEPATHAAWGDVLPVLSLGLLVLATAWLVLQRRTPSGTRGAGAARAIGVMAAAAAVGVTALTIAVGHSGAQAAWGGTSTRDSRPTPTLRTEPPVPKPTPMATSGSPASPVDAPTSPAAGYPMSEVAKHADASSCWTVVEGNVYDLTDWVERHPGGTRPILDMCGRDATNDFAAQHGGERRPERELSGFLLGPVSG